MGNGGKALWNKVAPMADLAVTAIAPEFSQIASGITGTVSGLLGDTNGPGLTMQQQQDQPHSSFNMTGLQNALPGSGMLDSMKSTLNSGLNAGLQQGQNIIQTYGDKIRSGIQQQAMSHVSNAGTALQNLARQGVDKISGMTEGLQKRALAGVAQGKSMVGQYLNPYNTNIGNTGPEI